LKNLFGLWCRSERNVMSLGHETEFPFDDLLPDWAIGTASELAPGAQLCTRDGRKVGNAVVSGPKVLESGREYWPVLTDAGTTLRLNDGEVAELFWPPRWLMDPATAPGARH
jgi:hypothetical protein